MEFNRDGYKRFFECLTGRTPYEYQSRVAEALCSGRNVVVRAPTGAGKTWAVLAPFFFEGWERRPARLIYALPLRTLAQGIYREARQAAARLGHRLEAQQDGRGREMEGPFVTLQTGEQPDDRFFDRGRIIVTTYDQVLSGLLCGPYGLSHRLHNINAASLVGTLTVFDEFHLMESGRAFLTAAATLNLLRELCQSVWMTATATVPLDEVLVDALNTVAVPGDGAENDALLNSLSSVISVRRELAMESVPLSAEVVIETNRQRVASSRHARGIGSGTGGRSIVLMNTVGRAQAMFEELETQLAASGAAIRLVLLHSRFFTEDRRSKEARIRELFGRGARRPAILVATQVIEAGLDISCDDLHTELCPMNALVQRAGRCARFEGEEGIVHVHPLPDGARAWLPYGDAVGEHPTLRRTRELLVSVQHVILDPRKAATWVQEVHAEDDAAELRKGWRGQQRTCVDRIRMNAIERDPVRVADLIRGEDTESIRVIVSAAKPSVSPGEREGLSLSRWSIARLMRENSQTAVGWWWDASRDDEPWQPLRSPADLQQAYVVCLSTTLAAYDEEVGLRLGAAGDRESPARSEPTRPGWAPLRAESWTDHARAVARKSLERLAREAWNSATEDLNERWDAAWAADGFLRRYDLAPRVIAQAVWFCAVLHDLGKLSEGWQRWAEAAQRVRSTGYVHSTPLAHTDFDPESPEDRALERALTLRRPPHAPPSAYYARLFLTEALVSVPLHRRGLVASACLAAILAHHGGWWPGNFEENVPLLWRGWESVVKDIPGLTLALTGHRPLQTHKTEDLLNVTVAPDSMEEAWPLVAFLTRTLRLSDQRATAEAGCHE
jgi:CRISPR-associated endonuclease/helicase Cas3